MPDVLAARYVHALSWALFAEIARRHPEFRIWERDSGYGEGKTALEMGRVNDKVHFSVNWDTDKLIYATNTETQGGREIWPLDALAWHRTDDLVQLMEKAADLHSPAHAPKTTSRTLTYRLAAEVAMTTMRGKRAVSVNDCAIKPDTLTTFPLVRERNADAASEARKGVVTGLCPTVTARPWPSSTSKVMPTRVRYWSTSPQPQPAPNDSRGLRRPAVGRRHGRIGAKAAATTGVSRRAWAR
jgi:type III secretion system-like peptide-binding chaperone